MLKRTEILIRSENDSFERVILHKAAWIVPVDRPPIKDGGVLVSGDSILEVAEYKDLKPFVTNHVEEVEHGIAAIMPGLVNAHTHLELSFMDGKIPLPQNGFAGWLDHVFSLRSSATQQDQVIGLQLGINQLLSGGTGLYADICNGSDLVVKDEFPERQIFQEVLGFNLLELESVLSTDALEAVADNGSMVSLAAHACYSSSAELIQGAKAWCRDRNRPFSIHVAEHADEIEFIKSGTGYCRQLLERLGKWVSGWKAPGTTPVRYLDSLGVLDQETLLVHAVHMQQSDWETVSKRRSAVCFCPRSNHNLTVGRADIEKAQQYGVLSCLGTDSLASNQDLSLFAEAEYVLHHYPNISPDTVVFMMTLGGAKALKQGHRFGRLRRGGHSNFLAVNLPRLPSLSELSETIIDQGNRGEWKWVSYTRNN